jgi:hypothetical protein
MIWIIHLAEGHAVFSCIFGRFPGRLPAQVKGGRLQHISASRLTWFRTSHSSVLPEDSDCPLVPPSCRSNDALQDLKLVFGPQPIDLSYLPFTFYCVHRTADCIKPVDGLSFALRDIQTDLRPGQATEDMLAATEPL